MTESVVPELADLGDPLSAEQKKYNYDNYRLYGSCLAASGVGGGIAAAVIYCIGALMSVTAIGLAGPVALGVIIGVAIALAIGHAVCCHQSEGYGKVCGVTSAGESKKATCSYNGF